MVRNPGEVIGEHMVRGENVFRGTDQVLKRAREDGLRKTGKLLAIKDGAREAEQAEDGATWEHGNGHDYSDQDLNEWGEKPKKKDEDGQSV